MKSIGLSDPEKAEVLRVLYAAAIDSHRHEELTDVLADALEREDVSAATSWLEPHIETATAMFEKLNYAGLLDKSSSAIVDQIPGAAAIINDTGACIARNENWASIGDFEKLDDLVDSDRDRREIYRTIRSLHTILEDRTQIIRLETTIGDFPILTFRRLPDSIAHSNAGSRVLVRASELTWPQALGDLLQDEFGLTELEFRTLKMIVSGKELSTIASEISRSRETVKSQTKSIYAKLDVSGREHLVRMVLQLKNLMANPTGRTQLRARTPDDRLVQLNTGRRIYWVEKGAENGRRVLFIHGLSLGHHFSSNFERLLAENNVTLVCVERPGYGQSDPPKDWKRGLEEWIDLYPELLHGLSLQRSPLVTQTGGVMLASAVAAHHPDLVSGICAFAAGVPITDRTRLAAYPPQVRLISRAARLSPAILRFLIMNAAHYFQTPSGRQRMIERTYANGIVDSAALKVPGTLKGVRRSLEMISDGGFDGFVSDNLHMFSDWSRFPKRVKCEIAYLNGTEDRICPIEWAREFASTVPSMTVGELEGAGNLMLHTHARSCLEHLLTCLSRFDHDS